MWLTFPGLGGLTVRRDLNIGITSWSSFRCYNVNSVCNIILLANWQCNTSLDFCTGIMSVLYSRIRCNSIIFNIKLSRHMSISWICTAQVDCWREIYFFTQNLANCEQISRQQYTWNLMIQLYLAENRPSTKTHASSHDQEPAILLSFIVCIIKITIKRPYRVTKPTYS